MENYEERIKRILNNPVLELQKLKTIRECARELGYADSAHVRNRVNALGLGINSLDLKIPFILTKSTLLNDKEFETLKASLENKQRAGRKPKLEKEGGK